MRKRLQTILLVSGLSILPAMSDVGKPIECTGWNTDMVAESEGEGAFDGASLGRDGDGSFYTRLVKEAGALCDDSGTVISSTGNEYRVVPDAKNALELERYSEKAQLVFSEPMMAPKYYFLVFCNNNNSGSADNITFVGNLNYADGGAGEDTTFETGTWDSSTDYQNIAVPSLGLIINNYGEIGFSSSQDYRIYEIALDADVSRPVSGVSFKVDGGSWGQSGYVLGVSADAVPISSLKKLTASLQEDELSTTVGTPVQFVVNYSIKEGAEGELECSVVSGSEHAKVGDIVNNTEQNIITIPVTADMKGVYTITATLSLGEENCELSGRLTVRGDVQADTKNCVEVEGWNTDVIAESLPAADYVSDAISNDMVLYTDDVSPAGSIAGGNRIAVADSGNVYLIAPYDASNANVIVGVGGYGTSSELSFKTPIYTENVNLLVASAEGGSDAEFTVLYEDGTESATKSAYVEDWSEASETAPALTLGYVGTNSDEVLPDAGMKLYEIPVMAARISKVKGIKVYNRSWGSKLVVLGVNAEDMLTAQIDKYLEASMQETEIRTYQNIEAEFKVNYAINGSDKVLEYNAECSNWNVKIAKIVNDKESGTLTIPVSSPYSGVETVKIILTLGAERIEFPCTLWVKSVMDGDTSDCIEIGNWSTDVIAENLPSADNVSQCVNGGKAAFYTDDVYPKGFVAGDDRLIITESGRIYLLAPYDSNNASVLHEDSDTAVLDFTNPIYTEQVNILAMSALAATDVIVTVIYEDESEEQPETFNIPAWNDDSDDSEAFRCGYIDISKDKVSEYAGRQIYEINVKAQRCHKVKGISIASNGAGSYLTILGVNAHDMKSSALDETASGSPMPVEYITMTGIRVERPSSGVYIVRFSDGSYKKMNVEK